MEWREVAALKLAGWDDREAGKRHSLIPLSHISTSTLICRSWCGEEESGGGKGQGPELRSENRVLCTSVS